MSPRPVLFVVDDEPIVGAVLKRLADPVGFDVVVCASAAEAVAGLAGHPADMAFVDLRMPETNGIDLLRQIRDTVPACEVVLMMARRLRSLARKASSACLRSSISVLVPYHWTTWPDSSRNGFTRIRNHR